MTIIAHSAQDAVAGVRHDDSDGRWRQTAAFAFQLLRYGFRFDSNSHRRAEARLGALAIGKP